MLCKGSAIDLTSASGWSIRGFLQRMQLQTSPQAVGYLRELHRKLPNAEAKLEPE